MMTLDELIRQLSQIRSTIGGEAPVFLEGHDEDDNLVQACVDGVRVERRCEDENEPPGVYLNLSELSIG